MKITDKEKATNYIELHKEQLGKFKQTRDLEFKINIALWTFLIIAGKFIKDELNNTRYLDYLVYLIPGYFILASIVVWCHLEFWMKPIARSEDIDDYFIRKYRFIVEKLSGEIISKDPGELIKPVKLKDFKKSTKNWIFFEVGITFLLLVLIGIYLFMI